MKKLIFFLFMALGILGKAQVSYVCGWNGYNYGNMKVVYLKHSHFKYYLNVNDSIYLYNLNGSLYKSFNIPGPPAQYYSVSYVSEGLFDNDTMHVEYAVCNGDTLNRNLKIYKENISTVYSQNNAQLGAFSFPAPASLVTGPIFSSDSGTFMLVTTITNNITGEQCYRLGGSFPCLSSCYGYGVGSLGVENQDPGNGGSFAMYPNPATTYTDIYYTLPDDANKGQITLTDLTGKQIKSFTVDKRFTHLHLSTTDVAAGTYIYQLSANGNFITAKKLVVVK